MIKRFARCCLIMVIPLYLLFFSAAACTNSDNSPSGLQIMGASISIGSNGENTKSQILQYKWQIKSNYTEEVLLQWIQPNLSDELANRLLTDDVKVKVSKVIGPGEVIEVEGAITFDSSGLTKQEIVQKCYITTDATISVEATIS